MGEENKELKKKIDWKEWLRAASVRALRSAAEAAIGSIGGTATIGAVNWTVVGSTTAIAVLLTYLIALKSLPEIEAEKDYPAQTGE